MPDTSTDAPDLTSRDTFAVWTTVSVRYGDLDPWRPHIIPVMLKSAPS